MRKGVPLKTAIKYRDLPKSTAVLPHIIEGFGEDAEYEQGNRNEDLHFHPPLWKGDDPKKSSDYGYPASNYFSKQYKHGMHVACFNGFKKVWDEAYANDNGYGVVSGGAAQSVKDGDNEEEEEEEEEKKPKKKYTRKKHPGGHQARAAGD